MQPVHHGILIIPDYHHWLPEHAAEELDAFVARGIPMATVLYEWKPRDGWQRRSQSVQPR